MARLDQYLITQGWLPSRESASEEIRAGKVTVNGKLLNKPGYKVKDADTVDYLGEGRKYVSRGAVKLLGAISTFALPVEGLRCIDVGASTGGFCQVLLEYGARSVTALDVGHDQLDPILRADPRVIERSGFNFRSLDEAAAADLGEFDLLTMDVSFISICLLAESVHRVLKNGGRAVILIKPQYEAGRGSLNKNGVLKDPQRHVEVLQRILQCYGSSGFHLLGLTHSPIQGPEGNIEYLLCLEKNDLPNEKAPADAHGIVAEAYRNFEESARAKRGEDD